MNQWENVMQKHAKSFYLASLFFPRSLLPRVKALYALCRWLDDAVDEAPNDQVAIERLSAISDDLSSPNPKMPVNQHYRSNALNIGYMQDLIEGARDDRSLVRIQNQDQLVQYSYKVAGTVGLAMFDLMKVEPPMARCHAVDLGIAMQITNICRDIKEDLERDRIYIPLDLLNHYGISESDFINGRYQDNNLCAAVKEMLHLADQYYESAGLAFNNIPWRSRGAILIASDLYRSIGLKLLKNGGNPMNGRVWLTPWDKTRVVLRSLVKWLFSHRKNHNTQHDQKLHSALQPWKELRGFSS